MPFRPVRLPLVAAMCVVGVLAGAGNAVVGHLLEDDVAEQVEISTQNQDGLICGFGKLAGGLVSIVDPAERPPEVAEIAEILPALDVDAACARLLEARAEDDATDEESVDAGRLEDLIAAATEAVEKG